MPYEPNSKGKSMSYVLFSENVKPLIMTNKQLYLNH
jgi:hypothetical protein